MPTIDEIIARDLAAAEASGELRAAPSWGRPLALDDGWDETPPELRMPFKLLREAGYVPHEVVMLRELAALRERLGTADAGAAAALRRRSADLAQDIALRLERLRTTGTL
ncbi:MAG TPA: DnaJ family domain-containing protein [Ideonella sp.]|nr:DnaJ family domain-containing protein [Ideonella sp.]